MGPLTPPAVRLKLIATDLDGTFLGADQLPSRLNVEAARRASAMGIRLVFATGRPARWLQPLEAVADLHPDAIASNGAVLFDVAAHRVRQAHPLPVDDALIVMGLVLSALPTAGFAVEYTAGWGRLPTYPVRGDFVPANVVAESPRALLAGGTPVKLLVLGPGVPTDELGAMVEPLAAVRLSVTVSIMQKDGIVELSAPGVSKASTLRHLLSAYDIDPAEVAAFGDMPNDLDMLELAGRPFAMADSHPTVLARGFPSAGDHNASGFGRTVMRLLDELDGSPRPPL